MQNVNFKEILDNFMPLIVFFVSFVILFWIVGYILKYSERFINDANHIWRTTIIKFLRAPLKFLCFFIAIGLGLAFSPIEIRNHPFTKFLPTVFGVFTLVWIFARIASFTIDHMPSFANVPKQSKKFMLNIIRGFLFGVGLLVILDTLGVSITPVLASLGVGSIAVALALQDTLSNFFSGIYITLDKPVREGDFIRIQSENIEGAVSSIGWRTTRLQMNNNNTIIIPNSKLSSSIVTNFEFPSHAVTVSVPAVVHSQENLEHVEQVALALAKKVQDQCSGGTIYYEPTFRYTGFGEFGMQFAISIQAKRFTEIDFVKHCLIKAIHDEFKKDNIEIPFSKQPAPTLKKQGS